MSDRELLELAAKAAGVEYITSAGQLWTTMAGSINQWTERWNPLANDGQALRLAMKVGLSIDCWSETGATVTYGIEGAQMSQIDEAGPDPAAATRRAIVRAAAAIGSTP